MYNLKDLKRNIALVLSGSYGSIMKSLLALALVPQLYSSCSTSFLNFFIRYSLFDTQSLLLDSSTTAITSRSNQFSSKIDSCLYDFDYVTNVTPVSYFLSVPTTFKAIRVGQIYFVPTTTNVIHVGQNCFRSNHYNSDTRWLFS